MRRRVFLTAGALGSLALAACGGTPQTSSSPSSAPTSAADSPSEAMSSSPAMEGGSKVVLYSGRNEKLVGPLIEQMKTATGLEIEVRYEGTPEMAAKILEEGANSPADLFLSQDAGALGALGKAGLLAALPQTTLDKVDGAYRDAKGLWVATSGRIRVLAVNAEVSPAAKNYKSIDEILVEENRGKIGYAPTNASFQSFVTALRVVKGEAEAEAWLTKLKELEPRTYEKNTGVLEAVDSGEVGIGLINHYYWYKMKDEKGDAVKAELVYLDQTDPGALLNVAGVGVLASSKNTDAALKVVDYLLSTEGQTYFADQTAEYPVIDGVKGKFDLKPIDASKPHGVDLNDLDSLAETQELLKKVGLI
ncbi:MAG: extracellular solute-binding protein [Propionibacteriaceae bacterium]|nr:extracellular solute-binding protein [Propionibacteriaceae bacterium]